MRILVCPDKFKGSLSAPRVASAMAEGFKAAWPGVEIDEAPMADGGDGTVDAFLAATGGTLHKTIVTGPLGETSPSFYGVLGDGQACVIEMAAASGLAMVPDAQRNPLHTTSFGTGELIRQALDAGYRSFIVGIGGSATNDGGLGMLAALGLRFYDENGALLGHTGADMLRVRRVDASGLDARIGASSIRVACDVSNPLCGPDGASAIFGPQKGATPDMIPTLDAGLARLEQLLHGALGVAYANVPGAGAAGGIGGALLAIGAELQMGTQIVIDAANLRERCAQADLLLTGEGATDPSTLFGKVPDAMGALAKESGVPCICLSGSVLDGYQPVYDRGVTAVFSIINRPMELSDAMTGAQGLIVDAAHNIGRALHAVKQD